MTIRKEFDNATSDLLVVNSEGKIVLPKGSKTANMLAFKTGKPVIGNIVRRPDIKDSEKDK